MNVIYRYLLNQPDTEIAISRLDILTPYKYIIKKIRFPLRHNNTDIFTPVGYKKLFKEFDRCKIDYRFVNNEVRFKDAQDVILAVNRIKYLNLEYKSKLQSEDIGVTINTNITNFLIRTGMTFMSNWVSERNYDFGSVCIYNNKVFVCRMPGIHPVPPDRDPDNWNEIIQSSVGLDYIYQYESTPNRNRNIYTSEFLRTDRPAQLPDVDIDIESLRGRRSSAIWYDTEGY